MKHLSTPSRLRTSDLPTAARGRAAERPVLWRGCVGAALMMSVCFANGQGFSTTSSATGWDNALNQAVTNSETRSLNLSQYAAAGNVIDSMALADAHFQAAPFSRSGASTVLDQFDPANGVLRQFSESRGVYFGNVTHPIKSSSELNAQYRLLVENLSGIQLNIVFGNHIRGVLAQYLEGAASIEERTEISGLPVFQAFARVDAIEARSEEGWANALFPQTFNDPYLGTIPGYRLNSFQFYGSRSFAPGESHTFQVSHFFRVQTRLMEEGFMNGMGTADFTGTANFSIRAYDNMGNDRTSEIRLTPVPEPASLTALAASVAFLLGRRRLRTSRKA